MRLRKALILSLFLISAVLVLNAQKPFDSKRDPQQDLVAAKRQAMTEHKNIWLDFGANWCGPCLELDRTLQEDPHLTSRLQRSYVVIHIDIGGAFFQNKKATAFRAAYPKFDKYPHVMILSSDGTLLHDEHRGDFLTNDDGHGYSHKVLAAFLDQWSPAKNSSTDQ